MKVSIVIINYNTFQLTCQCIRSVINHTLGIEYEIVLTDNASTECDPENFLIEFPQVKLIRGATNGGFAYGNNLGIENSDGEFILLLNSDTILQENTISKCLTYFEGQQGAGVLGCRMTYPDGSIQYSARRFRTISWELLDLFRFIPFLMPYKVRSKKMLGKYFRHDQDIECDWVNGAFFLFPRKILSMLPGTKLDSRFFMYGEDQLWCEQVRGLGYQIIFYSGTTIIHINNGSTDLSKQLKLRAVMMKNELQLLQQRKGKGLYYYFFKIIFVSKESIRTLIKSLIFRINGRLVR